MFPPYQDQSVFIKHFVELLILVLVGFVTFKVAMVSQSISYREW